MVNERLSHRNSCTCLTKYVYRVLNKIINQSINHNTMLLLQVKMLDNMGAMDEDAFDAYFEGERTWTTVLSDGTAVSLRPDGADITVLYGERKEYCQLVMDIKMKESNEQVSTQVYC